MFKTKDIFKTSAAVVVAALIGFGCGRDSPPETDSDIGTSQAIVEGDPSAANLSNPRPAPIGDTSETARQANRFGEMNPNQDTAARRHVKEDMKRQLRENPNERPTPSTPPNRNVTGQGNQ